MSDVKEVKVSLSSMDEKVLAPGARKRTRRNRRSEEDSGAPLTKIDEGAVKLPENNLRTQSQEIAIPGPAPAAQATPAPAQVPVPVPELPQVSQAPKTAIKIAAKHIAKLPANNQRSETYNGQQTSSENKLPEMKILPKKRFFGGAVKKPNFVVTATATPHVAKTYKKRRFGARKISIEIAPTASTRSNRKNLKKRIANMSSKQVHDQLVDKGLLAGKKATKIPEEMMRSMLRDYLLLHAAE